MNPLLGLFQTIKQFLSLLLSEFFRHGCPNSAAALTYTTLLSLVPLMAVSLAVFAAFPVSNTVSQEIQDFVFSNFVPEAGEVVAEHFSRFSDNASHLTGIGFIFLVLVSMLLMMNIHQTFRTIWGSRSKRSLVANLLIYWAVLTIGPLLIGMSVAVSSYLFSLPLFTDNTGWSIGKQLLKMTPFATAWLAFSMFYLIIPNQKVPFVHAVSGGFIAAMLFELAKHLFGLYISYFPTYQAIYGALAAIPIFLVWVYLSWMITLLGAEITHCLTIFQRSHVKGQHLQPAQINLVVALDVLALLVEAQKQGNTLSHDDMSMHMMQFDEHLLDDLLYQLRSKHWLVLSDDDQWVLARDMHQMTLKQLYIDTGLALPTAEAQVKKYPAIDGICDYALENLDVSIESVLS